MNLVFLFLFFLRKCFFGYSKYESSLKTLPALIFIKCCNCTKQFISQLRKRWQGYNHFFNLFRLNSNIVFLGNFLPYKGIFQFFFVKSASYIKELAIICSIHNLFCLLIVKSNDFDLILLLNNN